LADAGYDTAFCGKSHLGDPRDYGFTHGKQHPEYHDGPTFAFARDFLANRKANDTPFFLWVATHQPHVPLLPESQWLDLYAGTSFSLPPNFMETPPPGSIYNQGLPGEAFYRDSTYTRNYQGGSAGPPRTAEAMQIFMRGYYAVLSRLDAQIGTLVEQLKASGHYGNTVIIFLSDNGYMLGNHGLGNKITMHEESVRVPMFIHGSAVRAAGTRSDTLVSSLDVMPTVLELAGIPKPTHLAGHSLLPVLEDPAAAVRDYVASECVGVGGKPGEGHRMVSTTRWKYVLTGQNDEYLFDLQADPYELSNAIGRPETDTVLLDMRRHMKAWMATTGDRHRPPPGTPVLP
jgi:arylsulfatase A-like enzyme